MKLQSIAIATTAIALLAGSPAIAAPEAAAPIVVTNTAFHPAPGENSGPNFLNIAFRNRSSLKATKVVFDVTGGWYHQRVVDVGTFAPGVTINHSFPEYSGVSERKAEVVEVEFSNGTTWRRGAGR